MTSDSVKMAERTLNIFEAFAEVREPLSLTQLARHVDSPISSCHGLLRTLKARGYIYFLQNHRRYYPTRRLLNIGQSISKHDPLLAKLDPLMRILRDKTQETVILGQREGDQVIYLHVLESSQNIRYAASPGDYKPLHSSALGKALLGVMDDEALGAYLSSRKLKQVQPTTITEPPQLIADINRARKRGYFMTRGENAPEVSAIAQTFTLDGESLGACVAGPSQRIANAAADIVRDLTGMTTKAGALSTAR